MIEFAQDPQPHDDMRIFKQELRRLLLGDLDNLSPGALWTAAEYGDGSDEKFLRRLWRDLYVNEPIDERQQERSRDPKQSIEPYWRDNLHGRFVTLLNTLDRYQDRYAELVALVSSHEAPPWTLIVREDLQRALRDVSQIPTGALWTAAHYDDENDEAFLRRLWRDFYGDEPIERGSNRGSA